MNASSTALKNEAVSEMKGKCECHEHDIGISLYLGHLSYKTKHMCANGDLTIKEK